MTTVDNSNPTIQKKWRTRLWSYLRAEFGDIAVLPRSKWGKLLFAFLLLLGTYLRVGGLDWGLSYTQPIGPPHHDEPHVMHFLQIPWDEYKKQFDEYEIVRPVFLWRIIARPMYAVGDFLKINNENNLVFEYAVPRAVNSVFGVAGLLIIYMLGVRLGGIRTGLLAMALLTVLPGHWYYSQLLKGDLLVTTYDALLLLCAIRIYDRGSRFWYILAGLIAGIGTATKPSIIAVLPVVFLAHILRSVSQKKWTLLFSWNAITTIIAGTLAFALLYPYPFIDFDHWWKVLTEPTSQSFAINFRPSWKAFHVSWDNYNKPPNVFMEMIFGEALRKIFPLMAVLFAFITLGAFRVRKGIPYLLTLLFAFFIFHSLSFSPPLDDRYAMPLATFVVLFPAVLAGNLPFARYSWRTTPATFACLLLLGYTAAVTALVFPVFALGKDIRLQTVDYIESMLQPGETVGEFEAGGRQSLPFNRNKVTAIRTRTHEDDPHMLLLDEPTYMVVPVEPDNYDHAFRYQLYTPDLKKEFPIYLQSFEHIQRFGKELFVFGRKLPRMLSAPIFDVYRYTGTPFRETQDLLHTPDRWIGNDGTPQNPTAAVSFAKPTVLIQDKPYTFSDLSGKVLTYTFDLSDILERRSHEIPVNGTFAPLFVFDGNREAMFQPIAGDEADMMVLRDEGRGGLVLPVKHNDLIDEKTVSISFYFRPTGRIDIYVTHHGKRIGQTITPPRTFSTLNIGFAVAPRDPLPTVIRLTDVTLQTPKFSL